MLAILSQRPSGYIATRGLSTSSLSCSLSHQESHRLSASVRPVCSIHTHINVTVVSYVQNKNNRCPKNTLIHRETFRLSVNKMVSQLAGRMTGI